MSGKNPEKPQAPPSPTGEQTQIIDLNLGPLALCQPGSDKTMVSSQEKSSNSRSSSECSNSVAMGSYPMMMSRPPLLRSESDGASVFSYRLNGMPDDSELEELVDGDDRNCVSPWSPSPQSDVPRILRAADEEEVEETTVVPPPPAILAPEAVIPTTGAGDGGKFIRRILPSDQFPVPLMGDHEHFGGLFLSPIAFAWNEPKSNFVHHNIRAVLSCVSAQGDELQTILREQVGIMPDDHHCLHLDDSRDVDHSGGRSKTSFSLESGGALDQAVKFVHERRAQGKGVLVHCDMGVQRSPSTLCAYLIWAYNLDYDQATGFLRGVAPKSNFRIFQSSLRKVALEVKRQNMCTFLSTSTGHGGSQPDTPEGSVRSGYLGSPGANFMCGSHSPLQLQMPTIGSNVRGPSGLAGFSSLGPLDGNENATPNAAGSPSRKFGGDDSLLAGANRAMSTTTSIPSVLGTTQPTILLDQPILADEPLLNVNDPNALNLDIQHELTVQQVNGPRRSCNKQVPTLASSPNAQKLQVQDQENDLD